ncbi:hypothetical protein PIB30_111997, partial [Stylosanthes scabra]|nr:hypothetical protein [Stylosanthes scabra]
MSVTRSPHPCPLSITSSLMLQHETYITPTPQRHHNVTSCSLPSSLYTTPPTHHPRICVQPYAYAWQPHSYPTLHLTHPTQSLSITHAYACLPTHMRGSLTTHFLVPTHATIYVPISHAYAYNSMHMRGALKLTCTPTHHSFMKASVSLFPLVN